MITQIANIILFDIMILSLLYFWMHLRPTYLVDKFRENVLALRDEMFIDAADNHLAFDLLGYQFLRQTMNGYIRFGHRLTLLHVVLISFVTPGLNFQEGWEKALSTASPSQRELLGKYLDRLNAIVMQYLASTSYTLAFMVVAWLTFKLAYNRPKQKDITTYVSQEAYTLGTTHIAV